MSTESTSLFSLARNKLQSVVGGGVKDSCSLHRWVLLKNSIIRSPPPIVNNINATNEPDPDSAFRPEEALEQEEQDSFMFPDPRTIPDDELSCANGEDQWLDSLLESLEGDEDDFRISNSASAHLPATDEDSEPLSPLYSPMSSSDDLVDQSSFYSYTMPYSSLHPPLVPSWFALETSTDSLDSFLPATPPTLYDNPLPYYDAEDVEDSLVPDAIEDLSDDESDAPSTPSAVSSTSVSPPGSITFAHPRARSQYDPQVYVEADSSYFYSFEPDPLPFPHEFTSSSARILHHGYSEC